MEEEGISNNQTKNLEKRTTRTETSVNSKDNVNWIIYTLFLRHVFLLIIRNLMNVYH